MEIWGRLTYETIFSLIYENMGTYFIFTNRIFHILHMKDEYTRL